MAQNPEELKYTKSHEWVRQEADGTCTVGITDYAQTQLGDFVFIDLPTVGDEVTATKECCVTESVKAASDVYAPLTGKIVEVNSALESTPELVNQAPYGDGWLFKIEPKDPAELENLIDAAACAELEKD
jgi:glycine cleavage system H protein